MSGPKSSVRPECHSHNIPVAEIYSEILKQKLADPQWRRHIEVNRPNGLFVAEAKKTFASHLPQTLAEMHSSSIKSGYVGVCDPPVCMSQYLPRKKIVRGTLTKGPQWIFLILHCHEDEKGGYYRQSPDPITIGYDDDVPPCGPEIIAKILVHWVRCLFLSLLGDVYKHFTDKELFCGA